MLLRFLEKCTTFSPLGRHSSGAIPKCENKNVEKLLFQLKKSSSNQLVNLCLFFSVSFALAVHHVAIYSNKHNFG